MTKDKPVQRKSYGIRLDIELMKKVKILSAHRDVNPNVVVETALKEYLKANKA